MTENTAPPDSPAVFRNDRNCVAQRWRPTAGVVHAMGADQIHSPLVHGRTDGPTLNPVALLAAVPRCRGTF